MVCVWLELLGKKQSANRKKQIPSDRVGTFGRSARDGGWARDESMREISSCELAIGSASRLEFANFFQASPEPLFETLIRGFVPRAAHEIVRQALHIGHFFLVVMRVLVVSAITDIFRQGGDC